MRYTIEFEGEALPVDVRALSAGRYAVTINDGPETVVDAAANANLVHLHREGQSYAVTTGARGDGQHVHTRGISQDLTVLDARRARLRARQQGGGMNGGAGLVVSPMPGRIVKVEVEVGQRVAAGQGVVIMEAMKMENELRAGCAGVVTEVFVADDDRVEANAKLVVITPDEG